MNPRRKRLFLIAPFAILGIALFLFVGGEVVKLLWNWLLPPLFGWRTITFWQAFGILALCRILFGHHGWRSGHRSGRERMSERMKERWQHMTPEQRERMRERWAKVCGFEPPTETSPTGS
jgi:hypothetical protein